MKFKPSAQCASAHIYVKRSSSTYTPTNIISQGECHIHKYDWTKYCRHFKIQVTTELLFCHKSSLNFLCPFFLDFHILYCVYYYCWCFLCMSTKSSLSSRRVTTVRPKKVDSYLKKKIDNALTPKSENASQFQKSIIIHSQKMKNTIIKNSEQNAKPGKNT